MKPVHAALVASTLCLAAAMPGIAASPSQAFPSRPIRVVDPFPPGSPGDLLLRAAAGPLQGRLGQPVIVENRPGAGGNVAVDAVAAAAPDGHTLLTGPDTLYSVNPFIYPKANAPQALSPFMRLSRQGLVLACNSALPANNVKELIALSQRQPLTYSSGGNGTPAHLGMELLKNESPLQMLHVPYRGPSPAVQAVLSGEVSCGLLVVNVVVPLANAGRVKALAVTHRKRYAPLPQVPTLGEAGYPGAEVEIMLTLSAPKGTPPAATQALEAAFREALADPKVSRTLLDAGLDPDPAGQKEVQAEVEAASRRWGGLIQRIGLKVD